MKKYFITVVFLLAILIVPAISHGQTTFELMTTILQLQEIIALYQPIISSVQIQNNEPQWINRVTSKSMNWFYNLSLINNPTSLYFKVGLYTNLNGGMWGNSKLVPVIASSGGQATDIIPSIGSEWFNKDYYIRIRLVNPNGTDWLWNGKRIEVRSPQTFQVSAFVPTSAQLSLNGTTNVSSAIQTGPTMSTTTLTFSIPMKMTAVGGSMVKPQDRDFILYIASTTASTTLTDPASLTFNGYSPARNAYVATSTWSELRGTDNKIMQASTTLVMTALSPTTDTVVGGGYYTFNLIGTLVNRCATSAIIGGPICGGTNTAGNYRMMLVAASSTVGRQSAVQYQGLVNFKTPTAFLPLAYGDQLNTDNQLANTLTSIQLTLNNLLESLNR